MSAFAHLVVILSAVAGAEAHAAFRSSRGFVKALDYKHHLRVCNAFPYAGALDVYRGQEERLTDEDPMPYKQCRDFVSPLKAGDKLEFKVGEASAGTFAVADLPRSDSLLLLVVHRHDTASTAVAFESHVFATLQNAQVAIIDTYKGSEKATPRIADAPAAAIQGRAAALAVVPAPRSEELRYNSVVAVNPGKYEVLLSGSDGETKAEASLVALNRQSYVVLRTGLEAAKDGSSFPQELVVFPHSDASALSHPTLAPPHKSGAVAPRGALASALTAALALLAASA